jgi:excisionase family DNA binding protein
VREQEVKIKRGILNPPGPNPKRLYSIPEASVYLGRTVCALREMIWAGKLPYIRDGRRILLDINDMNAWVEKNKMRFED